MAKARRKILCIESDSESAAQIAGGLSKRGYDVDIARDGQEGFLAVLKNGPDLVLCEVSVPIMSGFEVLKRLTEIAPRLGHTPFIFMTGTIDRETELKGRQLGADDFVTKPIDFDVLSTIIDARLVGVARTKVVPRLTPLNEREIEALTWVARGKTSAEIGHKLRVAKRTVDFHIDNARIKLGAATRTEAAIKAATWGLIKP